MLSSLPSHVLANDPSIGKSFTVRRGSALDEGLEQDRSEFVLVEDGAILLYATNGTGVRYCLSIIGPGHVFTPQSIGLLFSDHDRFGVEAMRDVQLRRITREQWGEVSRAHPNLYNWVIEQETKQLQIVQFHLAQHSQRSSLDKTRFALCTYAQGLGMPHPCGSKTIRVSRGELASWIGVSSDRICRLIRELHESGEVELIGRSIKVNIGLLASLYPSHA